MDSIDIDNSDAVDILYFDFQKAFDQVPHHKLIVKMSNLGIDLKSINIVQDFLSGRTMKVKIGDVFSACKDVLSGVIQGSVIGPLLFIIFVNDLPNCISSLSKLFADDLKLIVSPCNFSVSCFDLDNLADWQNTWGLHFNLDKCKVLHIGKHNPTLDYTLNDTLIKSVENEKILV